MKCSNCKCENFDNKCFSCFSKVKNKIIPENLLNSKTIEKQD